MKLTINKLIANDIINYGMDCTSNFNYVVTLEEYLDAYEEESQKYILNNLDKIIEDIKENENVADLEVYENDGSKDIDMVFYWGKLLTDFEQLIFSKSRKLNIELDFEDIKSISFNILSNNEFNTNLVNKIKSYDKGKDIE